MKGIDSGSSAKLWIYLHKNRGITVGIEISNNRDVRDGM
jgi:hypothetical protein